MNKCYLNFRTDMADERVDTYKRVHNLSEIDGIKVEKETENKVTTTTVDVLNNRGEVAVGKPVGKYITMELHELEYITEEIKQQIIQSLAKQIKILVGDNIKSIMVVGLGNQAVTPDSLGPKVISYVNVTRHIIRYAKEFIEPGTREISSLSPGVMGTTGIETEEIIESVVNNVKPDLVIAVDSLASMSVERVGKTIQLGNTGITPGAGVDNKRQGLNKGTLGIPVIAIGVPTVVDMATITNEVIDKMVEKIKDESLNYTNDTKLKREDIEKIFELFGDDGRYNMIANTLKTENYMVTPKEIDQVVLKISEIISSSINEAI